MNANNPRALAELIETMLIQGADVRYGLMGADSWNHDTVREFCRERATNIAQVVLESFYTAIDQTLKTDELSAHSGPRDAVQPYCAECGENAVSKMGSWCRDCDRAANGPSDQDQEDAAESHDLARERDNQDLRDAGRGHLVR